MTEPLDDRKLLTLADELADIVSYYGLEPVMTSVVDIYFEAHPEEDTDHETDPDPEIPTVPATPATTATGQASTPSVPVAPVVTGTVTGTAAKTYAPPAPAKFWALYKAAERNDAPYRTSFATKDEAVTFLEDKRAEGKISVSVGVLEPLGRISYTGKRADMPSYNGGTKLVSALMAMHKEAAAVPVKYVKPVYVQPVKTATVAATATAKSTGTGVSVAKPAAESASVFTSTPPEVIK